MTVISQHMVLTDRYNSEWRVAPGYQDHTTNAPGWMLLRSTTGQEKSFSTVVNLYGVEGPDGVLHLRVRLDDAGQEAQ